MSSTFTDISSFLPTISHDTIFSLLTPAPLSIATNFFLAHLSHPPAEYILGAYILSNIGIFVHNVSSGMSPISTLLLTQTLNNINFLVLLFVQTAIRRLFFHPLSRFPGPKRHAISCLFEAYENFHARWSRTVTNYHRTYNSNIIRTGPNELAILTASPADLAIIYPRNPAHRSRGTFYNFHKINGQNLINEPDAVKHRIRRKTWDRAFRLQAVDEYSKRVEEHVTRMANTISSHMNNGIKERNVKDMCSGFAFDVMTDIAFGVPNYGMQDESGDTTYMDMLHEFTNTFAILTSLNDLMSILARFPTPGFVKKFRDIEKTLMKKRAKLGVNALKDVYSELAINEGGKIRDDDDLIADLDLLIIAGADTTAGVLTNMMYELCEHPEVQEKLLAELKSHFTSGEEITTKAVKSLPYLEAVINETLRLWPPVPAGMQSWLGPEGATLAGEFIPGGTLVRVHQWALMRDERSFTEPERFAPERWVNEGKSGAKVLNRAAFFPFSMGPHVCAGQQLAKMEMRLALATLVWNFEMSFGKNWDRKKFEDGWGDNFTAVAGEIYVDFKKRT